MPGGQISHTLLLTAPTSSEKLPAGQGVHVPCCSSGLKEPAGQSRQAMLPGRLYSPGMHAWHTELVLASTCSKQM